MRRVERRKQREKEIRSKKIKRALFLILISLIISVSMVIYYYINLYNKNSFVADSTPKTEISDDTPLTDEKSKSEYNEVDEITNILLIGLDARNPDNTSRSDTIMILTIDSVHKSLKVTSILRDTYVKLPDRDEQKINHSYYYGEAPLLMDTIESNFNIVLEKYAIINFDGFKHLVDLVGGLEINVEKYMIDELNLCIKELVSDSSDYLTEPGLQPLTGEQVLGYSRMRYLKGDGYARTERQREVVSLLLSKVSNTSVFKYPKIASEILPFLKTNVDITEALNFAYTVYNIDNYDVEKLQIPVNELSAGVIHPKKGWLLIADIAQNARILNEFIYQDIKYDKSNISYSEYNNNVSRYYAEIEAMTAVTETEEETIISSDSSSSEEQIEVVFTNNDNEENTEETTNSGSEKVIEID